MLRIMDGAGPPQMRSPKRPQETGARAVHNVLAEELRLQEQGAQLARGD